MTAGLGLDQSKLQLHIFCFLSSSNIQYFVPLILHTYYVNNEI